MAYDQHANFAYGVVATAPSPATTGTSLVLTAGQGARFPDPASGAYNVSIWPAGAIPTPANAEIVRVTAKSTDTLTITRAQEGSTARSVGVGDWVALTITAKTLTDIETNAADKSSSSAQAFSGQITTSSAAGISSTGSISTDGRLIQGEAVKSGGISPNLADGSLQYWDYTGVATMTINNPTNTASAGHGEIIALVIRNQRGGSVTALSWGTLYKGGMPTSVAFANNAYMILLFMWSSHVGAMIFIAGAGAVTAASWT